MKTSIIAEAANATTNRRAFLKHSTLAVSTVALSALPVERFAHAAGSDALRIGLIGTGDRGSYLMREIFAAREKRGATITAVCDVWKKNREAAVARVKQTTGHEPRSCTRYGELLSLSDVDAVVIATPDFSHGTILVAALEAGKDVYVEKPMTTDVPSANKALDLARLKERVVQAGTQRRSDGHFRAASKLVCAGAIGKVSRISGAMNVNSARWARRFDDCLPSDVDWEAFCLAKIDRPFNARLLRCWQLFRDTTNGIPGLWMTHYADAVHMVTGAQYPAAAVALGGTFVWRDGREHSDTFHAVLEYPEGFLFNYAMGLGNSAGIHFTVHGTQATLDMEKWRVTPEGTSPSQQSPAASSQVSPEPSVGHIDNWLACVRSRENPNADIAFGHQHAIATIMTAKAAETGLRQRWNSQRREVLPG